MAERPALAGLAADAAEAGLPADLRTILEGIAAGVTVQDEHGRLLFVNADAAILSGFATPAAMLAATPGEIVARFELIDEGGAPFDRDRLPGRQVLAGRDPETVLIGFRLLPGRTERWSMLRARAANLADGRRVAINTFHDVTPRIELETRIRTSESATRQLADRMERLQVLTRTMAESTSIDDAISIVAGEAQRALGASAVVVGLLDEAAAGLVLTTLGGAPEAHSSTDPHLPLAADDPLAVAVREARPVWVEDGPSVDVPAGCAVPLIAGDTPLGGLWLGFARPRSFSAEDQRLVRAYADLAAGAIVRLRLGAVRQQLLAANEAERARLESVLRQMPNGVILAGAPDGEYLYANEAATRLSPIPIELGAAPDFGRARGFRSDGTEIAADGWPLQRALAGETVEYEILEIASEDGVRRSLGMSAAPIASTVGAIEAAVVTFADVTDRIRDQARATFLVRAAEILTASLDYEQTVQSVADLAVPEFADWCVVHLEGDAGVPKQIAVAHRDPAKVALAKHLQEEYPPDPDAPMGTAAILRNGRSEFMADIPADLIEAGARDDRHLELLRTLALRSYVAVPLIAAGRIIGVLTLVNGESGRRFKPDDVAFAENLAARAAASIQNARLFREGVRFKRLLDATGDAVLMLDPADGRIVYANRGAATQLDRPVADLIGSVIGDHVEAPGRLAVEASIAALVSGASEARTETIALRRPDGTRLPIEVRLEYVAPDGGPARILTIARDLRDQIQAQESLRVLAAAEHARAAELDAVIRALGDGVVVCNRDGRIILANPAAEDVFPDIEERTYNEILGQLEDPDGSAPQLGLRGGPVELRVRGDDERWIELSTWPVAAGREVIDDHRDETIVLLRDVTEQRQRQAVRDTFIGVLSHELRTPVTTIYAGAKVLARPGAALSIETRQDIFADIVIESERLHRLVEDVVAMTRFGDEGGDVGAEPVLLQRLLPPVVASEDSRWPGVTFEVTVEAGLPTVTADPTYVEQVVRNLLSNAAKYGGAGTAVAAQAVAVGDEVQVRILDDGPGFPSDEADRLFDLFFRSSRTARSAAGAGIGLFVCARLIRAMGGRIWAVNRPEGGAEFGFALRVMDENG